MATKKQKREAALAKRLAFEEERRQTGLKAQEQDREIRARKSRKNQAEAKKINDRHNAILKNARKPASEGLAEADQDILWPDGAPQQGNNESIDLSRGKEVDANN